VEAFVQEFLHMDPIVAKHLIELPPMKEIDRLASKIQHYMVSQKNRAS
jgi:hypothetical protein